MGNGACAPFNPPPIACPTAKGPKRKRSGPAQSSAVVDLLPPALLRRAQHRVADLGGATAVLQRGAVRSDVAVVADRGQQVVQLVDEAVLPADHVALRPPVLPE